MINQLAALPVKRLILSIVLLSLMSPPMMTSVASVERRVGSSRHHHAEKPRPKHACHVART
jgi:DMSO/TMAO reductase YedYZ heme-binding membrane subunit